jgi:N-acetylmuramoyl-L-alanine amidase
MTVILDPGHGMGNRRAGVFDPGAVHGDIREADIAMAYANAIRAYIRGAGGRVVRTRVDNNDPAPVGKRAGIARQYGGTVMLSIHCNAAGPAVTGAECFYRGEANYDRAAEISAITAQTLGIRDRGAKIEARSQHGRLAVMDFQPCFLLELGFLTNPADRAAMLDAEKREKLAQALAEILVRG